MPTAKKAKTRQLVGVMVALLSANPDNPVSRDELFKAVKKEIETLPKTQFNEAFDTLAFAPGIAATLDKGKATIKAIQLESGSVTRTFVELPIEVEVEKEFVEEVIVEVNVVKGKKLVKKLEAVFHKQFPLILELARNRKNILLVGPSGSGKTHIAQQLGEVFDLPWGFISCTSGMGESKLGGKLLPIGDKGRFEYVISEFIKYYENGGVFLLDEVDAADANVMLFINAALSADRACVENRHTNPYAVRHPDFICLAAANTFGGGSDRQYAGRNKLDAAFLDRFAIGKIMMDYDINVESRLLDVEITEEFRKKGELVLDDKPPTKQNLVEWCWKIRAAIGDHGLERTMSTRFMLDAVDMVEKSEWTIKELSEAYFAGWNTDEKAKVIQSIA